MSVSNIQVPYTQGLWKPGYTPHRLRPVLHKQIHLDNNACDLSPDTYWSTHAAKAHSHVSPDFTAVTLVMGSLDCDRVNENVEMEGSEEDKECEECEDGRCWRNVLLMQQSSIYSRRSFAGSACRTIRMNIFSTGYEPGKCKVCIVGG
jgi:hypothetical protein